MISVDLALQQLHLLLVWVTMVVARIQCELQLTRGNERALAVSQ